MANDPFVQTVTESSVCPFEKICIFSHFFKKQSALLQPPGLQKGTVFQLRKRIKQLPALGNFLRDHLDEIIQSFLFAPDAGNAKQDMLVSQFVFCPDVLCISYVENVRIDTVVNDPVFIPVQERFLHFSPYPF